MVDFLEFYEFAPYLVSLVGGILIGIPTGPARFFVIDASLKKGLAAALRVYGGLFCTIVIYASLALMLDDLISKIKRLETISYFVAHLLLVLWGVLIIFGNGKRKKTSWFDFESLFLKGLLTGISNPVIPFIYFGFIQVLKNYMDDVSLLQKILFLLLFELFSFLTTSLVSLFFMRKKEQIIDSWKIIKTVIGIFLICLGGYNSFQQLDFSHGLKIEQPQSFFEDTANHRRK